MNNCWYRLNINNSFAIRQEFNNLERLKEYFKTVDPISVHLLDNQEDLKILFTEEWLEYMKSINLEVSQCLMFYRIPGAHHPFAHIDLPRYRKHLGLAINWCLDESDGEMVWYKPTEDAGITQHNFNAQYTLWPEENLVEIDRCAIGTSPVAVRTDIPHNVFIGNKPRWSFSFRVTHKTESWDEDFQLIKSVLLE